MKRLSTSEQRSAALPVLLEVERFYRARKGTLAVCLQMAADDLLAVEFARRVLRGVLWSNDIAGWEAQPQRRRAEVWRALKTAIRWCSRRPGGWTVAGHARRVQANMPAGRQWLEWSR